MVVAAALGGLRVAASLPFSGSVSESGVPFVTVPEPGFDGLVFALGTVLFVVAGGMLLGAASTRFLAPVSVGEEVVLSARRTAIDRRKHTVEVEGTVGDRAVFTGTFTTFVLDHHVLDGSPS